MIENLLLIDDDAIYSFIFPEIIRDSGLVGHFHLASDGQQGIDFLEGCTQNFPDLILVDLKMPVLDGMGFLQAYQTNFAANHPATIVLVMSSSVRQKDKEEVMRYSFVQDFLSKPITEPLLEQIAVKYFAVK